MAWIEQVGVRSYRVRYSVDGRVRSVSGFATRREASDYALDIESDRRRGSWIDPAAGRVTTGEWAHVWLGTLDLDTRMAENYTHRIRRHIEPRWGSTPMQEITASAAASCFDRRVLRPAVDGNWDVDLARVRTEPVVPGLTFHGLRHTRPG